MIKQMVILGLGVLLTGVLNGCVGKIISAPIKATGEAVDLLLP